MASHATRVRADIARWVDLGLIDAATAAALGQDVAERERQSISFGTILMVMASLLVASALLLVVASNWEAIPRLARVGGLFFVIAGGYVGGAIARKYDQTALSEGLWLLAAAAFGGAIALLGQMYHLSGDEASAILTWCAGTALAAVALRSGPLTLAAAGIGASWMVAEGFRFWDYSSTPLSYPLLVLAIWVISYWTRSFATRHFLLLSLVFYAVLYALEENVQPGATITGTIALAAFAASVAAPDLTERVALLRGRLPLHALFAFLTAALLYQIDIFEDDVPLAVSAMIVIAAMVAALVVAGRESRALRWIAYLGFSIELCFLYTATVGSMLGTAGMFLLAGIALAGVAFLIIRIERRLMQPRAAVGGAA